VIAGHKIPENPDDPRIIGETRQYIRDFIALDEATTTARQLYDAMLGLYPDRANPGSLLGCRKHSEEADLRLTTSRTSRRKTTRLTRFVPVIMNDAPDSQGHPNGKG
jgi:hypothetical protein